MMGIGKPQVVSDVGGHKEFCINEVNSLVVPVRERYYLPHCYCDLGGEAHVVNVDDFSVAMEKYVMDSELVKKHGAAAREKVLQYTWENVTADLRKFIVREIEDKDTE
jgi:glycosyltransferase involved in cell wall biosynthesis